MFPWNLDGSFQICFSETNNQMQTVSIHFLHRMVWNKHMVNRWRIEYQLDVTCYFISLLMCSTCFGHWYIHHQDLATILLNYHIGRIVLGSMCVGVSVWLGCCGIRVAGWSCASACNTDTTPTQPHRNSDTHWTKNNTTNVVIQQNSRQLLMMDMWMSETCWAHKKWNKIASDIKLVFYSSTITMMHGPINIRFTWLTITAFHLGFRICHQEGPRKPWGADTEWNTSVFSLCWWC